MTLRPDTSRDLMAALDTANRLRDEGTVAARENAARLGQLSETPMERSQAWPELRQDRAGPEAGLLEA